MKCKGHWHSGYSCNPNGNPKVIDFPFAIFISPEEAEAHYNMMLEKIAETGLKVARTSIRLTIYEDGSRAWHGCKCYSACTQDLYDGKHKKNKPPSQ